MLKCATVITSVLVLLCQFFFCQSACWAQGLFPNRQSDVFLLAPRSLTRLLGEGERAIQEGRYADAIVALSALIRDDSEAIPEDIRGQDFFLETGRRGLFNKTVKGEAQRLLAELPPQGRKLLEIEFGVSAQLELEQAVRERDMPAILAIARRYPHTQAGYDAMVLAGRSKLTGGHPLAAAGIFESLLDSPAARDRFGIGLLQVARPLLGASRRHPRCRASAYQRRQAVCR